MKKICMIVPSFTAKGGITSVVSGYRGSELEKHYQIHYIETYCDGGKAAKLCKAIIAYAAFFRELLFFRPDLIHVHSAFGASFYRKVPFIYIGSALGIPIVNHIHGAEWDSFYQNASEKSKSFKRKILNRCNYIIALSEEWRKNLENALAPDKIMVVANYGRIMEFRDPSLTRPQKNVLFLGFLCERKGCFDIPEVAALVRKEVENVAFTMAGSGSDTDIQHILDLTEKNGVSGQLIFPGWIRDVQKDELLKCADLFFLPSYAEGMPMAILEAMGCGLPIVSTVVGGIPQLVKDGENGFLCAPGDTKGMAGAIVRLLKDPVLQKKMGRESLNIVKTKYSIASHCSRVMAVYEKCCKSE